MTSASSYSADQGFGGFDLNPGFGLWRGFGLGTGLGEGMTFFGEGLSLGEGPSLGLGLLLGGLDAGLFCPVGLGGELLPLLLLVPDAAARVTVTDE